MNRGEIFAAVLGTGRDPIVAFMGGLCTYREARGEISITQFAQACSLLNRVMAPGWWGNDILSVVLKPWQYSSFNFNDPNNMVWPRNVKRPNTNMWGLYENKLLHPFVRGVMADIQESTETDSAWDSCMNAFNNAARGTMGDPTHGATNYFDISLNNHPPKWATDGSQVQTVQIGRLRFWKAATK